MQQNGAVRSAWCPVAGGQVTVMLNYVQAAGGIAHR